MMSGGAATKLAVTITAQNQTERAFQQLQGRLDGLRNTALAAAGAFATAFAFRDVIDTTRAFSREVTSLQDAFGLAAEEAAGLRYVGRTVGITAGEMETALGNLSAKIFAQQEQIAKGTSVFDKWGIQVQDAAGNVLSLSQILANTRSRMQEFGSGLASRAAEMELFGVAGGKLHEFLQLTTEQVAELEEEMRALGLATTDGALAAMRQFERLSARAGMAFDALKIAIGNGLLPVIEEVLTTFVQWVRDAMPTIQEVVIPLAREFLRLAAAVLDFKRALGQAIGALISAAFGVRSLDGFTKSLAETLRRVTGFIKSLTAALEHFAAMVGQRGIVGALLELAGTIKDLVLEALGELGAKLDELGPLGTVAKGVLLALGGAAVLRAIAGVLGLVGQLALKIAAIARRHSIILAVTLTGVALEQVSNTIQLVRDNWDKLKDAVEKDPGAIEGQGPVGVFLVRLVQWEKILNRVTGVTEERIGQWREIFGKFGTRVREVWDTTTTNARTALERVTTVTEERIEQWKGILGDFGTRVREVWDTSVENARSAWERVTTTTSERVEQWKVILGEFGTRARGVFDEIGPNARTRLDELGVLITERIEQWKVILEGFGAGVRQLWDGMGAAARLALAAVGTAIRNGINWVIENVINPFNATLGRILGVSIPLVSTLKAEVDAAALAAVESAIANVARPRTVQLSVAVAGGGQNFLVAGTAGIPNMHRGGIVPATPGGRIVRVAEAGQDEAIIPLPRGRAAGNVIHVHNYIAGSVLAERDLARTIREALVSDLRLTRQTA